jgi:D-psicose/D-tagatose/L-ribulose 3-epimerase
MPNPDSLLNRMDRRSFLKRAVSMTAGTTAFARGGISGASGQSASFRFKHAMCNEAFEKWPFAATCQAIRKAGYTGVELAPFTLADDPVQIPAKQRKEYASIMRSEGLTFAGLHWLLLAPKGLHVTTPDKALRKRSWQHVKGLIDLCADLGPDGVMVFGSPQQRSTTGGLSREEAVKNFVDGLAGIAPHGVERGVKVLIESFSSLPNDVSRTLDEAVAMVRQIGSPAIQIMFDTANAAKEVEPHAVLVDRYFDLIRHVHVHGTESRRPGAAPYDHVPVLRVLKRRGYSGWLSLEVFDFSPGPEKIARESLRLLEAEIAELEP